MAERVECAVIGAGVVGLAVARRLAMSGREVVVLEAETAFGTHTSSRNSEVIHAGIYYPTGSLKARLCVAGKQALYRYCAGHDVGHRRTGKIIVATGADQVPGLKQYREQAAINGVGDLEWLEPQRLRELEPEVAGVAGVLSPSTGIIDSHGLMLAYLGEAQEHGAALALASPVVSGRAGGGIVLEVGGAEPVTLHCRMVVNTAGFNAQAVARSISGIPPATIPPAFYAIGHYYTLSGKAPFRRLVYPVARREGALPLSV